MTTDDLYIDKSKEPLLEAYRSRISQVFQVNIAVCHDEDELPTKIFISLSDENCSSQNIKKAKNYLESLTAAGDTVTRINLTLSQSHFAMVQELQSTIERDSQAVVDLSEDHSHVCIFGKRENVSIAQTLINRFVKKDHSITPCIDLPTQSKRGYDDGELQEMPAFSNRNITNSCADFMQENVNLMKNDASENRELSCIKHSTVESVNKMSSLPASNERSRAHSVLKRTVSVGTCPLASSILTPTKSPLTRTKSHGYGNKQAENCLSNSKLSLQLSTSSDDETTDEEEYNTKIEFALKLGYSELQLALVLEKLGNKAGQNEILSELIKLSTCSDGGNFKGSDEGAVERLSENLTTFQLESCFELSDNSSNFRPIVIDGSNVAMSHGNKEIFSCRGIQLAVDWFKERGHNAITVFVPQWRKETSRSDAKITDQEILCQLEKDKILVFTPARRIGGKRVVCYDDRYILNLAVDSGGIVVSNDNYRDLVSEKPEYRRVVEERLLMYSFVNDRFMPPDDPLGRHGPNLDNFLSKEPRQPEPLPPVCPYGSRKCTYGNKCKFYHPERGNIPHKMVTEKLAEQAKQKIQEVRENRRSQEGTKSKQPLCKKSSRGKTALSRTQSLTPKLHPDGFATDTPTKRHSGDFGDVSLIKECKDTEFDDKWKCYNDKLSEHRKQVEQADIEHQRQRSETMESQFSAVKTQNIETFTMSSKIEHCGSRSSSPMQRSTPSPQLMQQQEVFLSGHLMLAKKLSDEAGETKTHKAEERRYNRTPPVSYNSPLATPVKEDQSLTQNSSVTLNQHLSPPLHQPVSQQFSHPVPMQHQHQKLSRQYSLQGPQDPRLQQRQMSSGVHSSRMPFQQDNAYSSRMPFQQDNFVAIQLAKNPFEMGNFSNLPSQFSSRQDNRFMGEESEHAALARMQSAPETIFTRTENNSNKRFGRMVRQNSSSDTQIHLLGEVDLGPNEYSLFPSEDMELNRGNQVNPQLSSGMNIQRMDLRQMKTRAVGYSKREYRSQHDNGETKWTFEPVLEHGSAYRNHFIGTQGIDAFESDYPPNPPWQDLKYPLQEHYQCQNQSYGLFQESARLPFSQHNRNLEHCHPERFQFQNQTSSNLFSTSNYCESQQHSMLQNPSCKQNIGVIGQEHKQNLSRTSSACMSVQAPSNQQNSAMNPLGATLIDTGGNQPKFTDFPPIKPSDNRYNLYYHLCGLFPEPKVRKVMNDHPEETSPQVLCAHIIGM